MEFSDRGEFAALLELEERAAAFRLSKEQTREQKQEQLWQLQRIRQENWTTNPCPPDGRRTQQHLLMPPPNHYVLPMQTSPIFPQMQPFPIPQRTMPMQMPQVPMIFYQIPRFGFCGPARAQLGGTSPTVPEKEVAKNCQARELARRQRNAELALERTTNMQAQELARRRIELAALRRFEQQRQPSTKKDGIHGPTGHEGHAFSEHSMRASNQSRSEHLHTPHEPTHSVNQAQNKNVSIPKMVDPAKHIRLVTSHRQNQELKSKKRKSVALDDSQKGECLCEVTVPTHTEFRLHSRMKIPLAPWALRFSPIDSYSSGHSSKDSPRRNKKRKCRNPKRERRRVQNSTTILPNPFFEVPTDTELILHSKMKIPLAPWAVRYADDVDLVPSNATVQPGSKEPLDDVIPSHTTSMSQQQRPQSQPTGNNQPLDDVIPSHATSMSQEHSAERTSIPTTSAHSPRPQWLFQQQSHPESAAATGSDASNLKARKPQKIPNNPQPDEHPSSEDMKEDGGSNLKTMKRRKRRNNPKPDNHLSAQDEKEDAILPEVVHSAAKPVRKATSPFGPPSKAKYSPHPETDKKEDAILPEVVHSAKPIGRAISPGPPSKTKDPHPSPQDKKEDVILPVEVPSAKAEIAATTDPGGSNLKATKRQQWPNNPQPDKHSPSQDEEKEDAILPEVVHKLPAVNEVRVFEYKKLLEEAIAEGSAVRVFEYKKLLEEAIAEGAAVDWTVPSNEVNDLSGVPSSAAPPPTALAQMLTARAKAGYGDNWNNERATAENNSYGQAPPPPMASAPTYAPAQPSMMAPHSYGQAPPPPMASVPTYAPAQPSMMASHSYGQAPPPPMMASHYYGQAPPPPMMYHDEKSPQCCFPKPQQYNTTLHFAKTLRQATSSEPAKTVRQATSSGPASNANDLHASSQLEEETEDATNVRQATSSEQTKDDVLESTSWLRCKFCLTDPKPQCTFCAFLNGTSRAKWTRKG